MNLMNQSIIAKIFLVNVCNCIKVQAPLLTAYVRAHTGVCTE